jgi:hypothetical protein
LRDVALSARTAPVICHRMTTVSPHYSNWHARRLKHGPDAC